MTGIVLLGYFRIAFRNWLAVIVVGWNKTQQEGGQISETVTANLYIIHLRIILFITLKNKTNALSHLVY